MITIIFHRALDAILSSVLGIIGLLLLAGLTMTILSMLVLA
jgi:hypothetical protein